MWAQQENVVLPSRLHVFSQQAPLRPSWGSLGARPVSRPGCVAWLSGAPSASLGRTTPPQCFPCRQTVVLVVLVGLAPLRRQEGTAHLPRLPSGWILLRPCSQRPCSHRGPQGLLCPPNPPGDFIWPVAGSHGLGHPEGGREEPEARAFLKKASQENGVSFAERLKKEVQGRCLSWFIFPNAMVRCQT